MTTTWRNLIAAAMKEQGEDASDIDGMTLTDDQLDMEIYEDTGTCHTGGWFVWTQTRVYFPISYEMGEKIESVPREPCNDDRLICL